MRKLCRVLFSRYAISAVMICLEVVIFTLLCIYALPSLYIVAVICALAAICALISLINRDANPEYKIPWAVIIIMIPALGPLMYLLFYKRRMSRKEAHRLTEIIGAVNSAERANEAFDSLERGSEVKGKARAILNDDSLSGVYRGTNSKLYFSGEELFADMISDLRAARQYIFMEYFIIDQGKLWDEIHGILREKAAMGVDVRLLYDDIGCMKTLPSHYETGLLREGREV